MLFSALTGLGGGEPRNGVAQQQQQQPPPPQQPQRKLFTLKNNPRVELLHCIIWFSMFMFKCNKININYYLILCS